MASPDERAARTRLAAAAALAGALVAVFAWAWADRHVAHGWSAVWYQQVEGERVEITRTTEHRVAFPNVHRPLARYVQGWPFDRLERPTTLPTIDVELRAFLDVPPGSPRDLNVDADSRPEIEIDGEPMDGPIEPGRHHVFVHWTSRPLPHGRGPRQHGPSHLELSWNGEPIPATAFTPAAETWPSSRVALWSGMALGTLLLAAWLFFAVRPTLPEVRARRLGALATALVVLLGTGYRLYDYDVMPEFRENADELFATWNGWSLLEDGTPRGWSLWPGTYGGRVHLEEVRFFGETRPVIEPYFEHPPLMHVLVGAAAHLGGAEHWLDSKLAHTRLVPIALSALAMVLIVAIGRRLTPRGPGPWLAATLYGVIPTIALQTRVIKEEDLLVVLSLAMVWFFLRWRDDGKRTRDLVLAAVCAGLAPCAKVPAVVWVPALVMLVAAERGETRRAFVAAGVAIATASLLLIYGALIDWDVFVFTQAHQSGRPTHWNLFPRFFDATLINHNLIGRGWSLFLWIGYAATVFRRGRRDTAVLTVPLVTYLTAIAIGSGNWTFGWYIVPLYPFLCLGAGDFLADLWERPTLLAGTLFVVLLVMYTLNFTLDRHWAMQPPSWPSIRRMVTITVAAFLTPYALVQVWRGSPFCVRLARLATVVAMVVVIVGSGHFIARYDTAYDEYADFDRDTYFHR